METDLDPLCALLDRYYTEWDIWNRDPPSAVLAELQHPGLGFFFIEAVHEHAPAEPQLAPAERQLAGCVLCRPLPSIEGAIECKRLFVAPEFRGQALATRLMDAAEAAAIRVGCHWMYLDSKDEFSTAIALYRRRGYTDCPRFNDNAQATLFLRKRL